jgi:hypothetical protein
MRRDQIALPQAPCRHGLVFAPDTRQRLAVRKIATTVQPPSLFNAPVLKLYLLENIEL